MEKESRVEKHAITVMGQEYSDVQIVRAKEKFSAITLCIYEYRLSCK
jgi:hypothetical protein